MNKKFLSAILFGALMVSSTGTFVSCKDYDDDIDDLQEQINKLATKDDMASQIATLQAALTSAAKDASDAIAKATAAETAAKAAGDTATAAKAAADKAAAEAKAAAVEAAKAEVASTKANLEKLVADGLADNKAEMDKMRKEVADAVKKVEDIVGKIADMVTSVELVYSYSNQISEYYSPIRVGYEEPEHNWWYSSSYMPGYVEMKNEDGTTIGKLYNLSYREGYKGQTLGLMTAIEKDNTFSQDAAVAGSITFKKDTQVQTGATFVVRVSPTNAVLTPAMISLVNSKGENLNDLLEVQKVEHFDGLLTRGIDCNGLWKVTVALKEYNEEAFKAAVQNNNSPIAFAVSVNNTLSTASERNVISSYDLSVAHLNYYGASYLNFFVNEKNIQYINNRYSNNSNSLSQKSGITYEELMWDYSLDNIPATAPINTGTDKNTIHADDRDGWPVYPVVQGEAFTIALTTNNSKVVAPSNIRAMYVTLDYQANAVESAPSEWNAWNSYSYTGLNKVVEGTSIDITINKETAINDIIGFRVYAVNYDGTLVDPDGKAFYVSVGAPVEDSAYNTTWTWTANGTSEISKDAVAEGVFEKSWVDNIDYSKTTIESDTVRYSNSSTRAIKYIEYYDADKKLTTNLLDAKYVSVRTGNTPAYWYDDNKTYSATISYKNDRGNVLKTITVTLKKVLPAFPAAFQAKVNQLNAEGTLNAFMAPVAGSTDGIKELKQSFNGLDDTNYKFIFKNAQKNAADELEDMTVTNAYTFTVANSFIDNTTKHAVEVSYNFGQISSETGVKDGIVKDYVVKGGEFKNIIFSCLAEINTYAWVKAPSLTYEQKDGKTSLANIKATNTRDGKYTTTLDKLITDACDNMIKDLSDVELWSQVAKDGAIKEGSKNEYFKPDYAKGEITFTPNSKAQNPEETVYSTLIIKAKDYFDHEVVITIKNVEVKKR